MFAGIMDGMHKQRAANTTNRRESSRLFNEHLKNAQEMGVEMNTEDLTNAWYQNSGGVLARHAPSQSRLQSIVDAQNKSIAEKDRVSAFKADTDQRALYNYVESDIAKAIKQNRFSTAPMSNADLYESLTGQYQAGSLQLQELQSQTRNGLSLGDMQSLQDNEALSEYSLELGKQIDKGFTNAEDLKSLFPSLSLNQIKAYVAKYQKTENQKDKEFRQADLIFARTGITFQNQQVVFNREQEAAILTAAQTVKDRAFTNKSNTMTIEAAKEAVTRLVIEQMQSDLVFGQGQYTFANGVEKEILTAVQTATERLMTNTNAVVDINQKVMDNAQTQVSNTDQNAIKENQVATIPAANAANANVIIERQVEVDEATFESVKAAYNSYNITDEAVIQNAWDLTNARQSRSIMTGMTTTNLSNASKLASSETDIAELIAKEITANSKKLGDHVKAITTNSDIASAADLLSQKYEMKGNFISAFQDEIKEKIDTGEWEEATQTQILISMTEMAQGVFPTYESKRASLVAAAKIRIGPDQYTPLAFKDLYMVEVQKEIDAHLATMNQAITNQDRNSFLVGQGSMASLAVEIIADLKVRGKIPQKAFGPAVTTEEISEAISGMTDIITQGNVAASKMEIPAEKEAVVKESRAFDANLYVPQLYASGGPITSIEGALSIINGKIEKATDDAIKYQFNPKLEKLEAAQLQFPVLVKQYDDLNKVYKGIKGDQSKLNEQLQVKEQMDEIAKNITKLQQGVARIVNNLQP